MDTSRKDLLNYLDYVNNRSIVRLGLDSWSHLLHLLPKAKPLVITVAGTNGKGSLVELISMALGYAGISYAAYTSPHIHDFKERLLINGKMLDDNVWLHAFKWLESKSDVDLTPFEFYTLSALYIAYDLAVEVLILEVGLGGRFDAVNAVEPDFSVITEVDFDHTELLGNTLSDIAYQKAGIMRAGKPVIFAGLNAHESFVDYANAIDAKLYLRTRDFDLIAGVVHLLDKRIKVRKPSSLALPSALAALQLAEILPFDIRVHTISAIESFALEGRFEQVKFAGHNLIFDVAHNPASFKNLMENVRQISPSKIGFWISLTKTKDANNCIRYLQDDVAIACISKYSEDLAHDCIYVRDIMQDFGIMVLNIDVDYDLAQDCLMQFFDNGCDLVVVAGSFRHVSMVKKGLGLVTVRRSE